MPKMFTELKRHALNGQTMGTRWSALFHKEAGYDVEPVRAAMADAVTEVDGQMSTWKPDSDLNRFNAALSRMDRTAGTTVDRHGCRPGDRSCF